jgi:hypothetical protein
MANVPLPTINGNGNHIIGTLPANFPLPNITLNAPQNSDDDDYQALFDNWDGVYANPDDGFGFGDAIEFGSDIGMPNPDEGVEDEIGVPNSLNGTTLNGEAGVLNLLNGTAPNDEAGMPNPLNGTAPNDEAEMPDSLGNGTMPNGV